MVNLARGYLRMKKSVLYVDTENGKEQIMDRFIQSLSIKLRRNYTRVNMINSKLNIFVNLQGLELN